MAACGTAVTVLTPNGRRQTVKVSPNTPLLQVTCVFKLNLLKLFPDGLFQSARLSPNHSELFPSELAVSLFG